MKFTLLPSPKRRVQPPACPVPKQYVILLECKTLPEYNHILVQKTEKKLPLSGSLNQNHTTVREIQARQFPARTNMKATILT